MNRRDPEVTIQELKNLVSKFEAERGWHNSPQSIAISICLEAAELLEHFQWDQLGPQNEQAISDELADIFLSCLNFSNVMDIDIVTAFTGKLKRLEKKYPVKLFNPESKNIDKYFRIKKAYRKQPRGQK